MVLKSEGWVIGMMVGMDTGNTDGIQVSGSGMQIGNGSSGGWGLLMTMGGGLCMFGMGQLVGEGCGLQDWGWTIGHFEFLYLY